MLPAEGNADKVDKAHQCRTKMAQGQPKARKHEPDEIAQQAQRRSTASRPKGHKANCPITKHARAHGRPMRVMAMITPASHQPSAMGKPPRMNQRRLNKKRSMAFSSFRKWKGSKRADQPRKTASPAGGAAGGI